MDDAQQKNDSLLCDAPALALSEGINRAAEFAHIGNAQDVDMASSLREFARDEIGKTQTVPIEGRHEQHVAPMRNILLKLRPDIFGRRLVSEDVADPHPIGIAAFLGLKEIDGKRLQLFQKRHRLIIGHDRPALGILLGDGLVNRIDGDRSILMTWLSG